MTRGPHSLELIMSHASFVGSSRMSLPTGHFYTCRCLQTSAVAKIRTSGWVAAGRWTDEWFAAPATGSRTAMQGAFVSFKGHFSAYDGPRMTSCPQWRADETGRAASDARCTEGPDRPFDPLVSSRSTAERRIRRFLSSILLVRTRVTWNSSCGHRREAMHRQRPETCTADFAMRIAPSMYGSK